MKTPTLLIFAVGIASMFGLHAFPQTTPYPSQGGHSENPPSGKTTQNKSSSAQAPSNKSAPPKNASTQHRAGGRGYHGYSHGGGGVGVGVGATVDLGGIGQRRAEPDPFAVPAERQPVTARTEEKPKTPNKPREAAKTNPFANVQLTGPQAKTESNP